MILISLLDKFYILHGLNISFVFKVYVTNWI